MRPYEHRHSSTVIRSVAPRPSPPRPAPTRRTRQNGGRKRRQGGNPRNLFRGAPVGRASRSFKLLFVISALLCALGLVMVLTSSVVTSIDEVGRAWYHVQRQVAWLCLGVIAAVVVMRIDYHAWRKPMLTKAIMLVTVAMLLALFVPGMGITVNGATRWLRIGPMFFQPSELAKLSLILFTASVVSRRIKQVHRVRNVLGPVMIVFLLLAGLIVFQPSLGSVLVLAGIFLAMLFIAGLPVKQLGALSLLGAGTVAAFVMGTAYRRARLLAFFDPWSDPYDVGYQTIQAQIGIASGGLTGLGPGSSRAALAYLPYAHSDFIFAIIAEELGLIGSGLVVLGFLLFGVLGIRIAREAPDAYGSILAIGISTWIVFQGFMNIAVAVGLAPTTGVPLPFISYGGSGLLLNLIAVGILLNIARQARPSTR